MADNIVAGLFGLSPYQVQQQRQQQINTNAGNFAQLDPYQQANQMLYKGGAGIARAGAGMMGVQDPAVIQAQKQQAALQGADTSTPEGLRTLAQRLQSMGMQEQAMMAAIAAQKM